MPFARLRAASPLLGRRTLLLGLAAGAVSATGVATALATAPRGPDPLLEWYDATAGVIGTGTDEVLDDRTWAIGWLAAARTLRRGDTDATWQHAALAGAVHHALVSLMPKQAAAAGAALAAGLARIPAGQEKERGLAAGRAAAAALIAERASDKIDPAVLNTPVPKLPARPGLWQPAPRVASHPAYLCSSRLARPFAMDRADQFRPTPPPALDSARYRADLTEVRSYGSVASTIRTQASRQV